MGVTEGRRTRSGLVGEPGLSGNRGGLICGPPPFMWFGCEGWDCGVEGITAAEGALYRSGGLCEEPVDKSFKAVGPGLTLRATAYWAWRGGRGRAWRPAGLGAEEQGNGAGEWVREL